jgi:hypothetical protein
MKNNQENLIEEKNLREEYISRIDVLEKVKELILLSKTGVATTQQVAEYYETNIENIQKIWQHHYDELISDGAKVFTKKEIENLLIGTDVQLKNFKGKSILTYENENITIPSRGMKLFPKRSILRIGMLLRDSKIAVQVRTTLLDIEENTQVEVKENIMDTETGLLVDIIKSYGDQMQLAIATGKYKEYTDRHRKALEMERDILVGQVINWNPQAIINNLIRRIGGRVFRGDFNKAWEKLWAELLYKHNIGVRSRITKSKKEKARTFDVLYPAEVQKALECTIALCNMYKIDITDVMIHNNDVKQIEA